MIVGITGTNGAGKGTIVDILKKKGFIHFSVRMYLENILKTKNLPPDRNNMIRLANDIRKKYCPQHIIEEIYKDAKKHKLSIIESIRCPGEIEFLKKMKNTYVFAIDANRIKRYNRIKKRGSSTDSISYMEFIKLEYLELKNDDPFKQNLKKCINMSDFIFENNGTIEDLNNKVDELLNTKF